VDTPVGYDMEIAIPLADLAIPAENGHVFFAHFFEAEGKRKGRAD